MNTDSPLPPSDDELDRLLASRLKHTRPEFEMRWRELRGELAGRRPARRGRWLPQWLLWPGFAAGAIAALAFVFTIRDPGSTQSSFDREMFEDLIALDSNLASAAVLLDPETRDALLHLPSDRQR